MKIIIFGLSITSSWGIGHATTCRSLIKGLHQRGYSVHFIVRDVPSHVTNSLYFEQKTETINLEK